MLIKAVLYWGCLIQQQLFNNSNLLTIRDVTMCLKEYVQLEHLCFKDNVPTWA